MKKKSVDLKNRIFNKKNLKVTTGITALALVTALTVSLVLDTPINPVLEVQAKETFSDISTIVRTHAESQDTPFTILDVVPGVAMYEYTPLSSSDVIPVDLNLATLGYLDRAEQETKSPAGMSLRGAEPILADLNAAYSANPGIFNNVLERKELASIIYKEGLRSVTKDGVEQKLVELKYEEVYEGTRWDFDSSDGWTLMFPVNYNLTTDSSITEPIINKQYIDDFKDAYAATKGTDEGWANSFIAQLDRAYHATSGHIFGTFEEYDDTAAEPAPKDGFDYIKIDATSSGDIPSYDSRTVFKREEGGPFKVLFGYDSGLTSKGYYAKNFYEFHNDYSRRTGLYKKVVENEIEHYEYAGTVEEIDEDQRSSGEFYVVIFEYTDDASALPEGTPLYKRGMVSAIQIRSDGVWPYDSYTIDESKHDNSGRPPLMMAPPLMMSSSNTGIRFVADENGTVSVNEEGNTATATPDEGFVFVNWTDEDGNEVSTDAEFTPTVEEGSENAVYTAHFAAEEGENPEGGSTGDAAGNASGGQNPEGGEGGNGNADGNQTPTGDGANGNTGGDQTPTGDLNGEPGNSEGPGGVLGKRREPDGGTPDGGENPDGGETPDGGENPDGENPDEDPMLFGGFRMLLGAGPGPEAPDSYFVYVGPGKGDYKLTETGNEEADKSIYVFNAPIYVRCINDGNGHRAKSYLREYVFAAGDGQENASNQFNIRIKTVSADQLTTETVSNADLIYLEDGYLEHLKVAYDAEKLHLEYVGQEGYPDMTWQTSVYILDKVVNSGLPVIVDHRAAYDIEKDAQEKIVTYHRRYQKSNYEKLAMILEKDSVPVYYDTLGEGIMLDSDLFDKLFKWETILDTDRFADGNVNANNYVRENIFINNDGSLLMGGKYLFSDAYENEYSEKGFSEILAAIDLENTGKTEESDKISRYVSKARAVQFIMCKVVADFTDLRILEIQPSANAGSDLQVEQDNRKNSTKVYWQSSVPSVRTRMLSSSRRMNVSVNTVSIDRFNSDLEDINANYSMIFIGLDGQRLNRNGDFKNVFNNSGLDGFSYMASHDAAVSGNYEGFDLLPVKESALYHFMDAGYPVVVEDACFTNKSAQKNSAESLRINTKVIEEGSRMYNFLARAVRDYHGNIYTVSDVHSSVQFLSRINISRPYIEQVDSMGKVTEVAKDENGLSTATIKFKVTNGLTRTDFDDSGSIKETKHLEYADGSALALFFDMNEDGVFAVEEMVPSNAYSVSGDTVVLNLTGVTKGLIPWSLEVYNPSNVYRRSAITGYFNVKDDYCNTIRVLQILADGSKSESLEDYSYNLESVYTINKANKGTGMNTPTMGYYLEGAEGSVNSVFDIKAMTVSEVAAAMAGDSANPANPSFIKSFDVLVLGLGPQYSIGGTSIYEPVKEFITTGRPVVYADNGPGILSAGVEPALLGMKVDSGTYSYLGAQGTNDSIKYLRYSGITNFDTTSGFAAEQNNEGAISNFPYILGGRINVSAPVGLQVYTLNYDNNLSGTSTVSETSDKFENVTSFWTLNGNEGSRYLVSPKDGRNNYYVYSKSNIYYIAQTTYPYLYTEGGVAGGEGADECKIFVNALINAYNVGLKTPKVKIVAGYSKDAPETESIMVGDNLTHTVSPSDPGYDPSGDTQEVFEETVEVYFKVADYNLASGKSSHVNFYYESNAGGDVDLGDRVMKAVPFGSKIYHVVGNREVEVTETDINGNVLLNPGETYKINAPVVTLSNERGRAMADIYIVADSDVVKFDGNVHSLKASDSVRLVRTQLFDLE